PPGEQHHEPVHAEGDAAVRRGTVAQRLEQKPELLLRLLLPDAERPEDLRLHDRIVEPDGAAPDLDPVEHEIVPVALHLTRVGIDEPDVVVVGAREGVVRRNPTLRVVVVLEERWVYDPQELPFPAVTALRDEPHSF